MNATLGAAELRRALEGSLESLRVMRAAINAVNVYPVPDGDTGSNLVMTVEAVVRALGDVGPGSEESARALRYGSLKGARGNSGVILAQFLRAFADLLELGPADPERVARAFKRAVELAYEAVLQPAEGTILSVARAAADGAQGDFDDVGAQFSSVARAASDALAHTPDQMPLLRSAGVVDAGGLGLAIILNAFAGALGGTPATLPDPGTSRVHVGDGLGCDGPVSLEYAYEVQYLLHAHGDTIHALRELLGAIGDSVAVIGGDGQWRVHVHTNERARAIAIGEAVGTVSEIEEVSFAQQIAEQSGPGARGIGVARAASTATLIAIAHGDGLRRLFEELGARALAADVSDFDLRAAFEDAPTGHIIVLPNDQDLAMRALRAAAPVAANITVLPAIDPAAGLAAAVAFGDARSVEDNVEDMIAVLETVRTAGAEEDCVGVAGALLHHGGTVLTVLCGAAVDASARSELARALEGSFPEVSVEVHDGGQASPRYLLAVE